MHKIIFAAIATLAVTLGSLTAASAAPVIGDGSNMGTAPTPSYSFAGG